MAAGKVGHYKAVTRVASEGEARPQPQSAMQFWKSRQKVSPADASTANPQEPKSGEEVRGSISPLKLYWERVNMKSSTEGKTLTALEETQLPCCLQGHMLLPLQQQQLLLLVH